MRTTKRTIRRLVAAMLTAAIPTVGLALPASAAGPGATIKISDVSMTEGNSGTANAAFTISATNLKGSATVHWATLAGAAIAGADFVTTSGTVSLSKAVRTVVVTVRVVGDVIDEPNETFTVQLSAPVGATISDDTGLGTIIDDDAPPVLSVAGTSVSETAGTVGVPVAMSGASSQTVTVHYATSGGTATAGVDYTPVSGTLSIPAGALPGAITVPISSDPIDEADETFLVALSLPTNATVSTGSAQVTILDDDAAPTMSVADVIVGEAASSATFDVSLTNPSSSTVTVDYATADSTALAGEDYTATTGTISFAPGDTAATIPVPVTSDAIDEPTQTFDVTLTNPNNATIGDGSATASILDDDGGPWVSVADVAVSESAGTATFTLTLDGPSQQDVTVHFATVDGTAVAGSDYAAVSGTATFAPGETTHEVVVPILNDTVYEGLETFGLTLTNPSNVSINTPQATATITSDDKAPAALTLSVKKTATAVKATGMITYAVAGMKVRVTLLKRTSGHWVKVAAKTVSVKNIGDRNGDGVPEATYAASFTRPAHGRYRMDALFAGNATDRPCAASRLFKL
jgi:Calx-beta domain